MTTQLDYDNLKMATIGNIQALERVIGNLNPYTFDTLWNVEYGSLCEIRDEFIKQYNRVVDKDGV